jgi:IS5 family transposase
MGNIYKSKGKKRLFNEQFAVSHLSEMGNPIESISKVIDFEMFRDILESRLLNTEKEKQCRSQAF